MANDISNTSESFPIGHEFDYVQITSNVNVTGTSGAQTTVITGNSVIYNGSTRIKVEFFAPVIEEASTSTFVAIELWDGSTDLMEICGISAGAANVLDLCGYGQTFLTPSAGSHQYIIKAYRGIAGTSLVAAGTGASGGFAPAFLRVMKA